MFTGNIRCSKCGRSKYYCKDCGDEIHFCNTEDNFIIPNSHKCYPKYNNLYFLEDKYKYCPDCGRKYPEPYYCEKCGEKIYRKHYCDDGKPIYFFDLEDNHGHTCKKFII